MTGVELDLTSLASYSEKIHFIDFHMCDMDGKSVQSNNCAILQQMEVRWIDGMDQ